MLRHTGSNRRRRPFLRGVALLASVFLALRPVSAQVPIPNEFPGIPQSIIDRFPEAEDFSHREAQRFFDYWLRGLRENGWSARPRIRYFQMGAAQWEHSDDWPPAGLVERTYHLSPDGKLSDTQPAPDAPSRTFRYDPRDPSPTVGGMNLPSGLAWELPAVKAGPMDQRAGVESRQDCLMYTTDVLDVDISLKGAARLKLHVSSDRVDTDVAARVCDVYPDGRSMLIADGIQRMRFRAGLTNETLMTPGQVYAATVQLVTTAHTFRKGHRIRIVITSSNYPRFDRNPNTGQHTFDAQRALVATNTVYHGRERVSALVLPVAGANAGQGN